eukprot:12802962-Alexandrium_andersonii.AAC.1
MQSPGSLRQCSALPRATLRGATLDTKCATAARTQGKRPCRRKQGAPSRNTREVLRSQLRDCQPTQIQSKPGTSGHVAARPSETAPSASSCAHLCQPEE